MSTTTRWSTRRPIIPTGLKGVLLGLLVGMLIITTFYIATKGKVEDKVGIVFDRSFTIINTVEPGKYFVPLPSTHVEYFVEEASSSTIIHVYGTFEDFDDVEYSATAPIRLTFDLNQARDYLNALPEEERAAITGDALLNELSLVKAVAEDARLRVQEGFLTGELEAVQFDWAASSEKQDQAIVEQYLAELTFEDSSGKYDFFCRTVNSRIDEEYYVQEIRSFLGDPESTFGLTIDYLQSHQYETPFPCDLKDPDAPRPTPTPSPAPPAEPGPPEVWIAAPA